MASVLTATSSPTRTSPVKRGSWILENILGAPPSPPPSGVEALKETQHGPCTVLFGSSWSSTGRNPACASCHRRMDPAGLRTRELRRHWEDGGTLDSGQDNRFLRPNARGTSLRGPEELKAALASRRDAFARCFAEKMLTFALGRGIDRADGRRRGSDRRAGSDRTDTVSRHSCWPSWKASRSSARKGQVDEP